MIGMFMLLFVACSLLLVVVVVVVVVVTFFVLQVNHLGSILTHFVEPEVTRVGTSKNA